jgi:hypothetical protein
MAQGQAPGVSGMGPEGNPTAPARAIREALNRILGSHEFRSSKRCQEFLRYVVETTLEGHADSLKERTIAIEVFGRTASYDPSEDATVRVKAGEVRKRLGLYYAGEGSNDEVRIDLPAGTYVPEFRWEQARAVENGSAAQPAAELGQEGRWVFAICLAALLAGTAFFFLRPRPTAGSALDQFWSPVLTGTAPVSLCASFVPVWGLRDPTASRPTRPEDFVQLTDQFVGGGDLVAVSEIASMLTRMKRPYHVRIGNEVSFEDLRAGPSILVGYSYTRWREISNQLRFFIDTTRSPLGVTDNGKPTKWVLPNLPADRRTNEDYAIVSRVFHPDTRAMLVEVAGITQYGTIAAADLVTSPDVLAEALRNAPAGWQKKNVQFVLHVKVISGTPTAPRVVASHFW